MNPDPYAAPASNPVSVPISGEGVVGEDIVSLLRGTRPWVITAAVILLLVAAFCALVAIGTGVSYAAMAEQRDNALTLPVIIFYGFAGAAAAVVGLLILRYGLAIGRLLRSRSNADFVASLVRQRTLWFWIVVLSVVIFIVIGMAVFSVVANQLERF